MNQHQEKLSLLQDLINLSKVDKKVTYMEQNFIFTIAHGLGIAENELQKIIDTPTPFTPQKNEMERITHFYRLLLLMGVDEKNHEKELQFCKEVGLKMGLNPIASNSVIEKILTSETHTIPPQEIIEIFKTYHN